MIGPGKYDSEASLVMASTQAQGVLVIVAGGNRGSGFSVQSRDAGFTAQIPTLLRMMADSIETDFKSGQSVN